MKLYIKFMVSLRCKLKVRDELASMGIVPRMIELGVVDLESELSIEQTSKLRENLVKSGLELLDNSKSILIERIKNGDH